MNEPPFEPEHVAHQNRLHQSTTDLQAVYRILYDAAVLYYRVRVLLTRLTRRYHELVTLYNERQESAHPDQELATTLEIATALVYFYERLQTLRETLSETDLPVAPDQWAHDTDREPVLPDSFGAPAIWLEGLDDAHEHAVRQELHEWLHAILFAPEATDEPDPSHL